EPGLILIVSPSQRQSQEMLRTFLLLYSKLSGTPAIAEESMTRLTLENGARVVALPSTEKTLRGYSKADLVVIDEAARCPDERLGASGRRRAGGKQGGGLIALSPPAGRRGWYFEAWMNGGEVWDRTRVPASECPRISQTFLDEELKALGPLKFSEEYSL